MSSFDPSKQKTFKVWEEGQNSKDLIVGVYSYDGDEPKVGFSRYVEKRDGTMIITKSRRLSWDDLMYIETIWEEIKETMEGIK